MVHALSYDKASGFDLAETTDELITSLQPYHFEDISRNTIFRCFQSSFDNKIYFDQDKIEKLAKQDKFREVIKNQSVPAIKKAVHFLYEELHVIDRKLLPYPIQLVFFSEFFRRINNPTDTQKDWLKKWFWLTTYLGFFTNHSLSEQREVFKQFLLAIDTNDFSKEPLEPHFFYIQKLNLPNEMTMRSVRSNALALFVINNLFAKCPEVMSDSVFRLTFIQPTESKQESPTHAPRYALFTNIEGAAYNRLIIQPSLYSLNTDDLFTTNHDRKKLDQKVMDASFFDINDMEDLEKRELRMKEAELNFIDSIGIIIDQKDE